MKRLIVNEKFWALFPQAAIAVITVKNINNQIANTEFYNNLLKAASVKAKQFITSDVISENPVVQKWRNAYQLFVTKKGARCSIEALLKRVSNQYTFTAINPLVDLYNTVSLTYGVPCGGEDLDLIKGDLQLGFANGTEAFKALGDEQSEPPRVNELVYHDDAGVVCRSWNWREAQRTMLTPTTKNAVLVIEEVDQDHTNLKQAAAYLQKLLSEVFKTTVKCQIMDFNLQSIDLD